MKKESLKSRKIAEYDYNKLWDLERRKEEILEELKKINKELQKIKR